MSESKMERVSDKYFVLVQVHDLQTDSYHDEWREVEGEPVKLDEYPELDLFVHATIDDVGRWSTLTISEGLTGLYLADGDSVEFAISKLRQKISQHTPQSVGEWICKGLSKFGLSPRYGGNGNGRSGETDS